MTTVVRLVRSMGRMYPLVIVLAVWQMVALYGGMTPLMFPRLESIWVQLLGLVFRGEIATHLSVTLYRTLMGFGVAVLLGVPLGFAMGRYRMVDAVLEPVFAVTYPVPRISLYPIFIFVFGLGHMSKVSLIALECLYPIAINTFYGTRSVSLKYLWAAQNMGAHPGQVLLKVVVPAASPFIFAGLRIALPVALVLAVLTEMISSAEGIGYLIAYNSASFQTARMFAALLCSGIAGFVLDRVLVGARKRLVFWEGEGLL